jgi:iron complex outermembrane receptor protein
MCNTVKITIRRRLLGAGLILSAAPSLFSQAAPAAQPSSPTSPAGEIVELAPFQVRTDQDVGYVASSSLSGSRLNSQLRDSPASISVMTAEFLADIGATDMEEALLYGNNVQKNVSDEVSGVAGGNSVVEFFANYRVRGIKANTARNYYAWNLPTDLYNVERVDQARGPNAILFGIGSAGGIINTSTKTARANRNAYEASVVFSSHDSKRGSIDINRVLKRDVLALRLNAVYDDSNTFRFFESSRKQLFDATLSWKPFARTTVRGQWETGVIDQVRTRPWGLVDLVSTWERAGRPVTATLAANAALGIGRLAAATPRVTYIEQSDRLYDLRGSIFTTVPATLSNRMDLTAPNSVNPEGPGAVNTTDIMNYTVSADQQLGRHTFVQLSFNHQEYDWIGYDSNNGEAHNLTADPGANLLTAANPYAGRYYVDTNWYRRNRRESFDTLRATVATELNFGKAGRHRLAVMGERQKSNFWRDERREFWAGAPFNAVPENNANVVFRRSYVTVGDYSTYRANGGKGQLIRGMVDQFSGRTLSSAWIQRNTNIDDDDTTLETFLIGDQSYFLNDRLVLTAGYRRDVIDILDRGTTRDPRTQEIIVDFAPVPMFNTNGNTRTLGAVGHVARGFSVFYNNSASINTPIGAHRVLPDSGRAPNWKGEGEDFGLLFATADGKYSFRATRYTTASRGETDFRGIIGTVTNRNTRVLETLQAAGQVTAADVAARTVNVNTGRSDRDSKGYEFTLVANPTPQWRVSVNYSLTDAVESNILPEVRSWADDAIAFWSTKNTALVTSSNITIATEIANLRQNLADQISAENIAEVGNRRHSFNIF